MYLYVRERGIGRETTHILLRRVRKFQINQIDNRERQRGNKMVRGRDVEKRLKFSHMGAGI